MKIRRFFIPLIIDFADLAAVITLVTNELFYKFREKVIKTLRESNEYSCI